jgi:hypothetical protein
VQFARASTSRAVFWLSPGKIVQRVEEFVVCGMFLMTLSAVKVLSSHVDFPFLESRSPENRKFSCNLPATAG